MGPVGNGFRNIHPAVLILSPGEVKSREVELGSHSWTDCLAAQLFLDSYSLDIRLCSAQLLKQQMAEYTSCFALGGVPTSLTLLFWRWLMVCSIFTGQSTQTSHSSLPYPPPPLMVCSIFTGQSTQTSHSSLPYPPPPPPPPDGLFHLYRSEHTDKSFISTIPPPPPPPPDGLFHLYRSEHTDKSFISTIPPPPPPLMVCSIFTGQSTQTSHSSLPYPPPPDGLFHLYRSEHTDKSFISTILPPTPPPQPPMSLTVSVDIKRHVYLLTSHPVC